ncbi:hypothetical protein EVAR_66728_1 [Eumeta japonica]|uniref:Uncharacterized protein n=1 Tax=Eumeta variegata TaxID=151549 RepID=A0A4C1ZXT2_EUMVA|nr:hypothetical protein EVAR_66728_1 [Eumeta japonica]
MPLIVPSTRGQTTSPRTHKGRAQSGGRRRFRLQRGRLLERAMHICADGNINARLIFILSAHLHNRVRSAVGAPPRLNYGNTASNSASGRAVISTPAPTSSYG